MRSALKHTDFSTLQVDLNDALFHAKFVLAADVHTAFAEKVPWNIEAIASDFAAWIFDKHVSPAPASRVSILSSFALQNLLSDVIGTTLSKCFRLLVERVSIGYSHGHKDSLAERKVTTSAGFFVLQSLEDTLSSSSLARAPLERLQALFLILFGTVIGIGYSAWDVGKQEVRLDPESLHLHHA